MQKVLVRPNLDSPIRNEAVVIGCTLCRRRNADHHNDSVQSRMVYYGGGGRGETARKGRKQRISGYKSSTLPLLILRIITAAALQLQSSLLSLKSNTLLNHSL